jgi:putative flippase GtrA
MPQLPIRFFRFGLVGAAGFLVDAGTLALVLITTPLDAFSARLIAIAVALNATWLLNRTVTFGRSGHSMAGEAARYGSVGIAGSAVNYAIYSTVLLMLPKAGAFAALFIASGSVMVLSYFGYSRLVFQQK